MYRQQLHHSHLCPRCTQPGARPSIATYCVCCYWRHAASLRVRLQHTACTGIASMQKCSRVHNPFYCVQRRRVLPQYTLIITSRIITTFLQRSHKLHKCIHCNSVCRHLAFPVPVPVRLPLQKGLKLVYLAFNNQLP